MWLLILLSVSRLTLAADWTTQDTLIRNNNDLIIVCYGEGPSLDTARKLALDQCHTSALDHLNTEITVKSLTIQTEKNANYHQEVERKATVKNLICNPLNEKFETAESTTKLYIKCKYSLDKISTDLDKVTESKLDSTKHGEITSAPVSLGELKKKNHIQSDDRLLSIVTIPKCNDILIRGNTPRSLVCKSNPISVLIKKTDTEIIIRLDGYKPKTMQLSEVKSSLEIYLEKN